MKWVITKDHINEGNSSRVGKNNGVGDLKDAAHLPYQFRLYDDDGELYFEGRCGDLEQASESQAFAPLDWALAGYGCTTMKYRKGSGPWQVL